MPSEKERTGIIYRPEVPMYKVRVTVLQAHPDCGARHKAGDTFEQANVNKESLKGFMCPTAYVALSPIIYAMRYGGQFPWSKNPDVWVGCCQDIETPVVFEIRRLRDET